MDATTQHASTPPKQLRAATRAVVLAALLAAWSCRRPAWPRAEATTRSHRRWWRQHRAVRRRRRASARTNTSPRSTRPRASSPRSRRSSTSPKPKGPKDFQNKLEGLIPLVDDLITELDDIQPPKQVTAEHEKLMTQLEDYKKVLEDNIDGLGGATRRRCVRPRARSARRRAVQHHVRSHDRADQREAVAGGACQHRAARGSGQTGDTPALEPVAKAVGVRVPPPACPGDLFGSGGAGIRTRIHGFGDRAHSRGVTQSPGRRAF